VLVGIQCAYAVDYARVERGVRLQFPRDHGAHPEYRTEWWYITGWLRTDDGADLGVQVTFFRSRPGVQEDNPSQFAPRQLLFAHAALADARIGRLLHDQRAAREGFGLAHARTGDTGVRIGDWALTREAEGYRARISAREFGIDLVFAPGGAVMLQGQGGYSRKGPQAAQASHYYSRPHLAVLGEIELGGRRTRVSGQAWLDHEWSSEYLAQEAAGWDWTGINLAGGSALMAFRIRDRTGGTFWAGGSYRDPAGNATAFAPHEIEFVPLRQWRSPRTGTTYPVAMRVRAGALEIELDPLMDDQELDARASTGTVYWEGAVRARRGPEIVGRGYLELTGYFNRLNF
jgi:predicted secreted hydrolase